MQGKLVKYWGVWFLEHVLEMPIFIKEITSKTTVIEKKVILPTCLVKAQQVRNQFNGRFDFKRIMGFGLKIFIKEDVLQEFLILICCFIF